MFTGIIRHKGKVKRIKRTGNALELVLEVPFETEPGNSVAVNGVCLTVKKKNKKEVYFDVVEETFEKTNLKFLKPGDEVNLEESMRLGDRIEGHLVQGHVDGLGRIERIRKIGKETTFTISFPPELRKYLVKKGSVAVDGISLTVKEIKGNTFDVAIIPHTLRETNLEKRKVGDYVNIETDMIARYLEGLMGGKNG